MAKTTRCVVHLTDKQIDYLLSTFGESQLLERYLADDRIRAMYINLKGLDLLNYPCTMPKVNNHFKSDFFKTYEKFYDFFKQYLKRIFVELAIQELAATGDIQKTAKRIAAKAPQFFEQRLAFAYEEISFNIRTDKLFNGQQTVDWLLG